MPPNIANIQTGRGFQGNLQCGEQKIFSKSQAETGAQVYGFKWV